MGPCQQVHIGPGHVGAGPEGAGTGTIDDTRALEVATVSTLLIDDRDGARTLTLNRPEAFNSLTKELKEGLLAALREAAADAGVRAVVLTGSGRAFCAGQDLKDHVALLESDAPEPMSTVREHYNPIIETIMGMPKPVIAAANGMAAGASASLDYACDLRVAGESAKFLLAFAGVGLTADTGASWTLPRLIGYGRAMELMLLGKPVAADEALRLGMVTTGGADDQGGATATELAGRMAAGPTTAYAKIKEAALASATAGLADALEVEARTQAEAGATEDHRGATKAFVAKEKPRFTGR